MYLLDEVAKEIQKDRLREAEMERLLEQAEQQPNKSPNRFLVRFGEFLVTSGLKLKGEYQPPSSKIVCRES